MRFLATVALFVSTSAFACPDLSGTFSCTTQSGQTSQMVVSQRVENGVTIFTANGMELIADNQARPYQEGSFNGTMRGWCEADTNLKMEMIGEIFNGGTKAGDANMITDFTRTADGGVVGISTGTYKDTGGTEYSLNDTQTCTRL